MAYVIIIPMFQKEAAPGSLYMQEPYMDYIYICFIYIPIYKRAFIWKIPSSSLLP